MVGMPVDSNLIKRAKRNPILLKQNRRSSFALEQEAEHLGEGAAVWEWIRTLGGSGTPESCPRWGTDWLGAPEPCPWWLAQPCSMAVISMWLKIAGRDGVSAENKDIFMNSTLKDALKKWAKQRGLD